MSLSFNKKNIDNFGFNVASYLKKYKKDLSQYNWPMNDSCIQAADNLGLLSKGKVTGKFGDTIQLRKAVALQARAIKGNTPSSKDKLITLSDFVIRSWGALSGNKPETIEKYVTRFTNHVDLIDEVASYQDLLNITESSSKQLFKFDGIASWSKWISFVWSDWALIYDARIAFALNAIHFIKKVDAPVLIEPNGRNTLLKQFNAQSTAAISRLALINSHNLSVKNAKETKKMIESVLINKDDTYIYYLEIMAHAHKLLWDEPEDVPLLHTEMLLFSLSIEQLAKDFFLAQLQVYKN